MMRIRRATRDDATAIARVHVEAWQSAFAGLLPDSMLAGMSDVRYAAMWSPDALRPERGARRVRGRRCRDGHRGLLQQLRAGPRSARGPRRHRAADERGVYLLYVETDFQKQGAGRRLLDALFRQLRSDGFDTRGAVDAGRQPPRASSTRGAGGQLVGERTDTFSGADVDEVAFAWRDLEAPLVRRRLAPDET